MSSKCPLRVLLACSLLLKLAPAALAQSVDIPPLPAPTIAPAQPARIEPKANILFNGAAPLKVSSKEGRFPLTEIRPREVVEIGLEFPIAWANTPLIIQAPDGGDLFGSPKGIVIRADGTAAFQFQAGDQPGLYRLSISGGGGSSTLKFWVPDATKPRANPPVITPER